MVIRLTPSPSIVHVVYECPPWTTIFLFVWAEGIQTNKKMLFVWWRMGFCGSPHVLTCIVYVNLFTFWHAQSVQSLTEYCIVCKTMRPFLQHDLEYNTRKFKYNSRYKDRSVKKETNQTLTFLSLVTLSRFKAWKNR